MLRPVTYNFDGNAYNNFVTQNKAPQLDSAGNIVAGGCTLDFTSLSNIIHSGFIAQEVEQAAIQ